MKNLNKTITDYTGEQYEIAGLALDVIIHTGCTRIQAYVYACDREDVTIVTDPEVCEELENYRTKDLKSLVKQTATRFLNLNNNKNYELGEVVYAWDTEIYNYEWDEVDKQDPDLDLGCYEPCHIELILAD